jgi:ankyrin repeat protein
MRDMMRKIDKELIKAIKRGQKEKVKELLEQGADVNTDKDGYTALCWACWYGHYEIAELLLQYGALVDLPIPIIRITPLMLASWYGYPKIVESLLKHGANPNNKTCFGQTALSGALKNGHKEIVELLKSYGAKE